MPRKLAITKRVSLAGFSDGWDDQCYVMVVPATYEEYTEVAKLKDEGKTNLELLQWMIDFVKAHVTTGKVNVLNDKNKTVLDDFQTDDIDGSKELVDILFAEILGMNLDPKGIQTATAA